MNTKAARQSWGAVFICARATARKLHSSIGGRIRQRTAWPRQRAAFKFTTISLAEANRGKDTRIAEKMQERIPLSLHTKNCGGIAPPQFRNHQPAASFSFLSGRILILTLAGFAANHCSSLVNGLMPLRFGLAGTLTAVIFRRPGSVNEPTPFL
jgi:hypothetical protein